jgi:hypothetical protein
MVKVRVCIANLSVVTVYNCKSSECRLDMAGNTWISRTCVGVGALITHMFRSRVTGVQWVRIVVRV